MPAIEDRRKMHRRKDHSISVRQGGAPRDVEGQQKTFVTSSPSSAL